MTAVKAISSEPTQGLLLHHTHGSAPHSQKCSSTPARKLAAMIFVGALGPAECRGSWLCSARKRLIAACSSTARRKKLVWQLGVRSADISKMCRSSGKCSAAGRGGCSCLPASRGRVAGRCARSSCSTAERAQQQPFWLSVPCLTKIDPHFRQDLTDRSPSIPPPSPAVTTRNTARDWLLLKPDDEIRLVVCPSSTPAGKAAISYGSGPKPHNQPTAEFAMRRRSFLGAAGCLSVSVLLPGNARAQDLQPGWVVVIRCLGNIEGPRWLDGRTANGTVGLAPNLNLPYTSAKWQVTDAGEGAVAFRCLGNIEGPRWLDGRTADGTVGLAPNLNLPYTGARWQVTDAGGGAVAFRCLGNIEGPRWLDGRTADATVGLAPNLNLPYTGARW